MRSLTLLLVTALSLAACRKNADAGNSTAADQMMSADNIVTNDVTAIDAVTADAANMAADINYMEPLAPVGEESAAKPTTPATTGAGSDRSNVAPRRSSPKPSASKPATRSDDSADTATSNAQ